MADPYVPELDPTICLTGHDGSPSWQASPTNRRVMVSGFHGTGKSTHIEQVAARLTLALRALQPRQPCQP